MACTHCDGTGWRPIERDGVRRVERCDCWQDSITTRLIDDANIPPLFVRRDLDDFVIYPNEKLIAVLASARRFADAFPVVTKGLCLIGPVGIGKTHIAASVLRRVITRTKARGLFYAVGDLLKLIRSTYNPVVRTAEMDIIRPVMEADLLVLDDLGREKPTEWVEETLNLIVDTRYNCKRPTIFTTNYEDMSDDTELDALKVRVGFRMHSRMHEMCEFLEFDGADYRHLPPNGGPDDLVTLWKKAPRRRTLPARSGVLAKAQLQSLKDPKPHRELNWPGGKEGRG